MIKSNELRIGNWVNTMKGHRQCIDVLCDSVNFHDIKNEIYENIDPILLSDQWLFNFGFKYRNSGIGGQDGWAGYGTWELGDIYFQGLRRSGIIYFSRIWKTEMVYVHQLQNLYFALTGEELTIKK